MKIQATLNGGRGGDFNEQFTRIVINADRFTTGPEISDNVDFNEVVPI